MLENMIFENLKHLKYEKIIKCDYDYVKKIEKFSDIYF